MATINNIAFTGIRNVGGCTNTRILKGSSQISVSNNLILQLTDDYNGADLSEFKKLINKGNTKNWFKNFPGDNRVFHVMTHYGADMEKEFSETVPSLFINYKLVPVERETLPIFSFIAKITRRISNMADSEFKRSDDFKYGIIGRIALVAQCDFAEVAKKAKMNFEEFMDNVPFSNDASRETAEVINKNINEQMKDYLR